MVCNLLLHTRSSVCPFLVPVTPTYAQNLTQPRLQMSREKINSERMFIRDQLGSIFLNISTFPSKHTNNLFIDRTQSQHPITARFALSKGKTLLSSPEPLQRLGSSQSVAVLGKAVVIKSRKK